MDANAGEIAGLLSRDWWPQALRGMIALVFGVLVLIWPRLSLVILVQMFGVYVLANGVLTFLYVARVPPAYPRFGTTILQGLVSIAAGVLTFVWPRMNGVRMLMIIAAWAITSGLLEIVTAIELRKILREQWLLGLAGLISWVFGMVLLAQPSAGALGALAWIGGFVIALGLVLLYLAWRVSPWRQPRRSSLMGL